MGKKKAGAAAMPDTLGVENTIRTGYLLERIRGAYYVNKHIGKQVTLGDPGRPDMPLASPGATMKILVSAKHLFLDICTIELGGEEVVDLVDERRGRYGKVIREVAEAGCGDLAGIFRRDLETTRRIVDIRNRFSAHPTFPLEEAIRRIEKEGFAKFWQCARRLLLLKDAIEATPCGDCQPARTVTGGLRASGLPYKIPTGEEMARVKKAYEGPIHKIEWSEGSQRQIMRECAACIRVLLDEFLTSHALCQSSPSAENRSRLCDAVYSTKYAVTEMHDFVKRYERLGLAGRPGFMDRQGPYKTFRNQYGAHNDEDRRVTSLVQLLNHSGLMSMLLLDMHEALCLSGRLYEELEPRDQIRLPSRGEIAGMDAEIEDVRQRLRERLGSRFANGEHERGCAEFRAYIQDRCVPTPAR